jgi:glutamate racemase
MNIGIFDSGCGGFSIINQLIEKGISGNIYYYADTLNCPWGNKSKRELEIILNKISNWFNKHNPQLIISGCNTSYSLFKNELNTLFNKPVLNIIENTNHFYTKDHYSVLATKNTIHQNLFKSLLTGKNIQEIACPDLATLIEKNQLSDAISYISHYISKAKSPNIILGCTHYPLLINTLNNLFPKHHFIDPSKYFVNTSKFKEFIPDDLKKKALNLTFNVSNNTLLFNQLIDTHLELETFKSEFPHIASNVALL